MQLLSSGFSDNADSQWIIEYSRGIEELMCCRRTATPYAVLLNLPSCILRSFSYDCGTGCLAFFAGTPLTQELPGVDSQIVIVVPVEFDGVFANPFR
jgi:hypothetical protein